MDTAIGAQQHKKGNGDIIQDRHPLHAVNGGDEHDNAPDNTTEPEGEFYAQMEQQCVEGHGAGGGLHGEPTCLTDKDNQRHCEVGTCHTEGSGGTHGGVQTGVRADNAAQDHHGAADGKPDEGGPKDGTHGQHTSEDAADHQHGDTDHGTHPNESDTPPRAFFVGLDLG